MIRNSSSSSSSRSIVLLLWLSLLCTTITRTVEGADNNNNNNAAQNYNDQNYKHTSLDEPFQSSFHHLQHSACVTLYTRNGRSGCGTVDRQSQAGAIYYYQGNGRSQIVTMLLSLKNTN